MTYRGPEQVKPQIMKRTILGSVRKAGARKEGGEEDRIGMEKVRGQGEIRMERGRIVIRKRQGGQRTE
jgi:hypothetical protein